ncbi:hypothetical protein Kpol_1020p45 [Vanderwaltozyma polyspora DSM 70294]|uniref:DMAP1-binding domain-containing protein n=1 Tax=Vanderwaltozyma polyspora (strain ATCC 22028 / DSM 70294 / BCRC 21397 / CBS 2163 / NBRC 10782 / NRRL Y-8283 / UCD 57-17) TaxID=436907 RepID=A7TLF5_VANPO|nr:uncharacterized protein Kpol_1020p45 [Vanderwaltozyma polyspora DSM 70294]EDO16936.1 hypothetical protein Kpol_1020p45 [Vanderwaltozyma polyspora DSM 70294]
MDFSIPPELPIALQNQLSNLIEDYKVENLTRKGYETKRNELLDKYTRNQQALLYASRNSTVSVSTNTREHNLSTRIILPSNKRFIDDNASYKSQDTFLPYPPTDIYKQDLSTYNNNTNTTTNNKIGITKHERRSNSIYRVATSNSSSVLSTPRHKKSSSLQLSLHSNDAFVKAYNPMIPLLPRIPEESSHDSLPSILRARYENYEKQTSIISIDNKGKENSISWAKLYLRAEKIAHELNKSRLYKKDKVLLWYNRDEVIEFAIALLGCFIAGIIAVPVSFETYKLGEIIQIIKLTNSSYVLISNECHKQLDNLQTTSNNTKIKLIKDEFFSQLTFLKTSELGTYSKAKKNAPTFDIPDISYIEFTRTPLGRLSGVVMKHRALINQLKMLVKIMDSRSMPHWKKNSILIPYDKAASVNRYTILNSLDPTRSTGLVLGLLFGIYSGNLLISISDTILKTPGNYEDIINQHKADVLLNDQLQLKQVVINYLENPKATISKKNKIDFSCIKCCLTSCINIDTDVSDMIVNKWLKNLGCVDAAMSYSPILTLPDIGGTFISVRDHLGKIDNFPIHNTKLRLQDELYINKEKLRGNVIEPSITAMINSSNSFTDYMRLTTFGFPIPDSTICVVNLDDCTLVPDLTVGEIWISSKSLCDEFYQMDRVNEFIFHAKLDYPRMLSYTKGTSITAVQANEKINMIMNLCPPSTNFLRTKLMGFVFNGKIYVLSMIEDMFLQNKLLRLPNWAHTSDMSKEKESNTAIKALGSDTTISDSNNDSENSGPKRIVQTYYLQQVTETIVRTVPSVSDVSAFELNHNNDEHFLVLIVESSLAKNTIAGGEPALVMTSRQNEKLEKQLNDLTEQIFRILWIFHKIQPMCVMVVANGSLPKRYCSLELANSTIERRFLNCELDAKFVKFQFDNIILDFIPHSLYYNESIFSEHLSTLRRAALADAFPYNMSPRIANREQRSGFEFQETSYDLDSNKNLTDFATILEILEWRINTQGSNSAFSDGTGRSSQNSNDNNIRKSVSWKKFGAIVASFLKKIIQSKTPLEKGDKVIIMCENSTEYAAIVIACLYCNLNVIPLEVISEETAEVDIQYFTNIIKNYSVKRVFIDSKTNNLFENNTIISKIWKRYKSLAPKLTIFSKVKVRSDLSIQLFKKPLAQKFSFKTRPSSKRCVIWINKENDTTKNVHSSMTHQSLMKSCKILKESFKLSRESSLFSICGHTFGFGFLNSVLLGIYTGCQTTLFDIDDFSQNPNNFLIGIQNLSVRDLFLTPETFYLIMDRASTLITSSKKIQLAASQKKKQKNSNSSTILRSDFLRNVQNIMIPFSGRPKTLTIENVIKKYNTISINPNQISYIYQNRFNFHISMRSYLGIPPVDLLLDPRSLKEGLIKEIDPAELANIEGIRIQDSGVVPICTDVAIVNPETLQPCLEGEFGEIWCCSEGNASDYYLSKDASDSTSKNRLFKDQFITEQFRSKIKSDKDNGLTYLRTGDLGFIKRITCQDSTGANIDFNLLYVLGSINETIDILGLTYFVSDLESTVRETHSSISNCIITKSGGLLVCLVKCKKVRDTKFANLTALITSSLLQKHGIILDLCSFIRPTSNTQELLENWTKNRVSIMKEWFSQDLVIESQFGINYGENISIYLLSDFERDI